MKKRKLSALMSLQLRLNRKPTTLQDHNHCQLPATVSRKAVGVSATLRHACHKKVKAVSSLKESDTVHVRPVELNCWVFLCLDRCIKCIRYRVSVLPSQTHSLTPKHIRTQSHIHIHTLIDRHIIVYDYYVGSFIVYSMSFVRIRVV